MELMGQDVKGLEGDLGFLYGACTPTFYTVH